MAFVNSVSADLITAAISATALFPKNTRVLFFGWRSLSPGTSCDKQQTRGWCVFRDPKTLRFHFEPVLPTRNPIAWGR
jgi:hypothetical protein